MAKPDLSDPITLRLPVDVLAGVEAIAEASDRTRSWVMVRALRHYLAGEGADILNMTHGLREIASGQSHGMGNVIAEIADIVHTKAR